MSRAGLDALLADADALASRLAAGDPTDARAVVEGLAAAVRDLRDERDRAQELLGMAASDTWTALPATDKAEVAHLLRLAAVSMRSNAAADRRRGFLPRADDADRLAAAHLALADHIDRSIGREPPSELPSVTWVDAPERLKP